MSERDCSNCPELHKQEIRLTKLETESEMTKNDVQELKSDIKEIRNDLKGNRLYTISTLVGILVTIGIMVVQNAMGG